MELPKLGEVTNKQVLRNAFMDIFNHIVTVDKCIFASQGFSALY